LPSITVVPEKVLFARLRRSPSAFWPRMALCREAHGCARAVRCSFTLM